MSTPPAPVTHVAENSPEEVALKLVNLIAIMEIKRLGPIWADSTVSEGETAADRKWLLDTYAECLEAVKGSRIFGRDA